MQHTQTKKRPRKVRPSRDAARDPKSLHRTACDPHSLYKQTPDLQDSYSKGGATQLRHRTARASQFFTPTQFMPAGTLLVLFLATLALVAVLFALGHNAGIFNSAAISLSAAVWICTVALIIRYVHHHDHHGFGYANMVTTVRALCTTVLAGCVPVAASILGTTTNLDASLTVNAATNAPTLAAVNTPAIWGWALAIGASLTLCLDGLDGYLARRDQNCSAFGARFDMEIDALLALIIALILWQSGKVGLWVLGLGSLRYAFLAASIRFDALRAALFPSMRRKVVCVIQVGALCLMVYPWVSSELASLVGMVALVCLVYSFATDIIWLFRHKQEQITAAT